MANPHKLCRKQTEIHETWLLRGLKIHPQKSDMGPVEAGCRHCPHCSPASFQSTGNKIAPAQRAQTLETKISAESAKPLLLAENAACARPRMQSLMMTSNLPFQHEARAGSESYMVPCHSTFPPRSPSVERAGACAGHALPATSAQWLRERSECTDPGKSVTSEGSSISGDNAAGSDATIWDSPDSLVQKYSQGHPPDPKGQTCAPSEGSNV
jgi:hypothetical protein